MKTQTIEVTDVPEDLVKLLDERVERRHASGRSEYVRELIRRDVIGENRSLREILASVHADPRSRHETEGDLDTFFDEVRDDVYRENQAKMDR